MIRSRLCGTSFDELARRLRIGIQHGGQRRHGRVPLERPDAGHHLVEHCTEAEDVRACVHFLAGCLLRRHIRGGSDDFPRPCQSRILDALGGSHRSRVDVSFPRLQPRQLRHAEVEDLDPAVGHHDVGRLQVPVDDASFVRGGQRVCRLNRVVQRIFQAEPLAADQLIEGLPGDELHRNEVDPVFGGDVVDGDDAGVVQRRRGLGFTGETAPPLGVADRLGAQGLDRHKAVQMGVARLVDNAHPSPANPGEDLVVRKSWTYHGEGWSIHASFRRRARLS